MNIYICHSIDHKNIQSMTHTEVSNHGRAEGECHQIGRGRFKEMHLQPFSALCVGWVD